MNNDNKIKIFFGCSMRGGYGVVEKSELAKFPDLIEDLGYVLASRHQTGDWQNSEKELTDMDIHDRDYQWLIDSEAGVFEISNPSLGVGGEISDLVAMGKPVICLFKKGVTVSAYTAGKQESKFVKSPFKCVSYETLEQAKYAIEQFLLKNIK